MLQIRPSFVCIPTHFYRAGPFGDFPRFREKSAQQFTSFFFVLEQYCAEKALIAYVVSPHSLAEFSRYFCDMLSGRRGKLPTLRCGYQFRKKLSPSQATNGRHTQPLCR